MDEEMFGGTFTNTVPDAAKKPGTLKGQEFDFFGNPVYSVGQRTGQPNETRYLDPLKIYLHGSMAYPRPNSNLEEQPDPLNYKIKPFVTPFGVLRDTELEVDPNQYADEVEEDARLMAENPMPQVFDESFLEDPKYKHFFKPSFNFRMPPYKKFTAIHEQELNDWKLKREIPDIAPRDPVMSRVWNEDEGPPPGSPAALAKIQEQIKQQRQQQGGGVEDEVDGRLPPTISEMYEVRVPT
uniref:Uncharacterized protein n=1 Tax=Lotharella globosa TaxID=91324 RepID=A0A7S3YPD8_9EUKA